MYSMSGFRVVFMWGGGGRGAHHRFAVACLISAPIDSLPVSGHAGISGTESKCEEPSACDSTRLKRLKRAQADEDDDLGDGGFVDTVLSKSGRSDRALRSVLDRSMW